MSSIELAPYEPSDRDDYLALLGEAWGHGGLTGAEFDWWFDRNPAGSVRSIVRLDGKVVGVSGITLFRTVIAGVPTLASYSVHGTTLPEARGRGVFQELQIANENGAQERGAQVALAFASPPSARIFLGVLGWQEIGRPRIWARLLPRSGEVEPADSFDVEGDAAAGWENHVVRDAEHLTWRYLGTPRPYVVLRSENGYAALWPRKSHKGRTVAVLNDVVAPPGELSGLLKRAVRAARARILFGMPGRGQEGAFKRAGFIPTNRTLHLIGRALNGPLDLDVKAWRFTLGDTDFF